MIVLFGFGFLAALAWFGVKRWHSRSRPVPEARLTWRLVLPREARFGVADAAAWFAALAPRLSTAGPHPTIELCGARGQVELRLSAPRSLEAALRGQLAAWFPGVRLEALAAETTADVRVAVRLRLEKPDVYPLRVPGSKEVDPLVGLFGVLAEYPEASGVCWTWGPAPRDWPHWAPAALRAAEAGRPLPPRGAWFWVFQALDWVRQAATPTARPARKAAAATPSLAEAAAKVHAPVFQVSGLVWAGENVREGAEQRVREILGSLRAGFRHPFGNAFVAREAPHPAASRNAGERHRTPPMTLSAAELAALFHLPARAHPLLSLAISRHVPPPAAVLHASRGDAPGITWLGEALTPERPVPFGLGLAERQQHLYVLGKTGVGKSTLLATLLKQDLEAGRGVGLLDPHGDLAEQALALVPSERAEQLCYFNPADTNYPVGINLLAATTPAERPLVASSVVSVFKKLYSEFWGPRLENTLRHALLVLLETSSPSLIALPKLLTDRNYRQQVLAQVRDPILRSFFLEEYESYDSRWRAEAVSPILNKIGQFLASPTVRHIVGQSQVGLDLRQLIDGGGILIANLSTGRLGEDNAALLGGLLVAGFQLAAMARASQAEANRRDFFLHIDEFPHFANDAFAAILSQARKYHLGLTLSHQYLAQLPPGMREAVLGNAASLCAFRLGTPDAGRLVRELAPRFDVQDLVHLPNHQFAVRLTHGNEPLPAFSARTVSQPAPARDLEPLIAGSRRRWARPRGEIELEIADLWEGRTD